MPTYTELGATIGTETTQNIDFLVFDWDTEYANLLRGIKNRLGIEKFEELSPYLQTNPAEFFTRLPHTLKQDIKLSLKYQLLATLWEYTRDNHKVFPYSYVIRQNLPAKPKLIPSNYLYTNQDFLFDLFARAPLSQPHEILTPTDFDRRFDLRVDQTIGLHRAREHMLAMHPKDLVMWLSPPGEKKDGFPGYSFVYLAQKQPDEKTIYCYALLVPISCNMSLSQHAAFLNSYLPESKKAPNSPTFSDILHQAVLVQNSTPQTIIDRLNSVLDSSLTFDLVDIEALYQKHHHFIDQTLDSLFSGASPVILQRLFQSYNRSLRPEIIQATGGSGISGCGRVDFGKEGENPNSHETPASFICPACGLPTDPCYGICKNYIVDLGMYCHATPANHRKRRVEIDHKRKLLLKESLKPHLPVSPYMPDTVKPISHTPLTSSDLQLQYRPSNSLQPSSISESTLYTPFINGLFAISIHRSLLLRFSQNQERY